MSVKKVTFIFLISLAFLGVASWTIDLPDARRYHFEKDEKTEHLNNKDERLKDFNEGQKFFDNFEPDSPHNKEELHEESHDDENDVYGGRYANEYEYMSYMEKKVHGIVHNGSVYLEGLRAALEDYGKLLQSCNRGNFTTQNQNQNTTWLPQNELPLPSNTRSNPKTGTSVNPTATNPPNPNAFDPNTNPFGQIDPTTNPFNLNPNPFSPQTSSGGTGSNGTGTQPSSFGTGSNLTGTGSNGTILGVFPMPSGFFDQYNGSVTAETCERATRASEHIRRLAELALWATRELQDKAYAEKYEKPSTDEEEEELELLLRLAFFLDRLAYFTGFVPEPKDYTTPRPTRPPPPQPTPFSVMGDVPEDVKTVMINCLNTPGTEPATERCKYPLQHPEFLRQLFNITDAPDTVQRTSDLDQSTQSPAIRTKRDLLTAVKRQTPPGDRLTALKRQIRSIDRLLTDKEPVELKNNEDHKESDQDVINPMLTIMKYYVKHKVWTGSNQEIKPSEFDVSNDLTAVNVNAPHELSPVKLIKKRAVDVKSWKPFPLPENSFQYLSKNVNHKKGLNYIKDDAEEAKIKEYLNKIKHSDRTNAKKLVKKLEKSLHREKRSYYNQKKVLPSLSQDPRQDLSYYVKNREGTEYRNNLVQAAEVRAGLEAIFQYPNIEVVRRYGSNYNPAIPFPLGFGIVRSFFVDI